MLDLAKKRPAPSESGRIHPCEAVLRGSAGPGALENTGQDSLDEPRAGVLAVPVRGVRGEADPRQRRAAEGRRDRTAELADSQAPGHRQMIGHEDEGIEGVQIDMDVEPAAVAVGRAQEVSVPVYGVHDIELGEGVDASEFEQYVLEKFVPAWTEARNGMRMTVLKGDRGERKGKYQLVYVLDSADTRDRFFPTEDKVLVRNRKILAKFDSKTKKVTIRKVMRKKK